MSLIYSGSNLSGETITNSSPKPPESILRLFYSDKRDCVAELALSMICVPVVGNSDTMFGGITVYAAEINQTANWFQDGMVWKVKDGSGNIVKNAWFCDLDGSWYLMDEKLVLINVENIL